jgi:hypothetical protein
MSQARYYLSHSLFGEREVTREQFIAAERAAGFYPKFGQPDDLATGGFSSGDISGSIRHAPLELSAMVRIERELLVELAESVECEVEARYGNGIKDHPAMANKYAADIEPAQRAREILAMPIEAPDVRLDLLETAIAQGDTPAARELLAEVRTRLSVQDTQIGVLRDALDAIRSAHRFNVTAMGPHEVHAVAFAALELVTAPDSVVLAKQAEAATEPFADALRALASYVGAGGYNAPDVDPAEFERKIRWGIDQLLDGKSPCAGSAGTTVTQPDEGKVCACQFGSCLGAEEGEDCKAQLSKTPR